MKQTAASIVMAVLFSFAAAAQHNDSGTIVVESDRLPLIEKLDSLNPLFQQYNQDVENSYMRLASNEQSVPQTFYRYAAGKDDTLFTLAARLSLPYETVATLNSIPSPDTKLAGHMLILPVVTGLFVSSKPESAYELILKKRYAGKLNSETVIAYSIGKNKFYFLQNEKFSPTERAFFLDSSMKAPLAQSVMTSPYGYRVSPIDGKWKFHPGIDLAAPIGSAVYACKPGKVTAVNYNDTYGNYIIILHDGGMTSVYAHLSKTLVKRGDAVDSGTLIGLVGTTGASTGPHLHFEVRVNGSPTNPGTMLPAIR
jgi:murein DD-endopeptidase MepM/ murein hydrolase activator NlpD